MNLKLLGISFIIFFAFAEIGFAQEQITGPLIEGFGNTYTVPAPDLPVNTAEDYKVVFDIAKAPEDPASLNLYFNTVARFLNMHVAAGVDKNRLKAVLVVHGSAAFGLMKNEYYKEKFGIDNPNLVLLNKLHSLDIPIILCGQTAGSRDISTEKRWKHTKLALSAMTALIHYQNLDYALISF